MGVNYIKIGERVKEIRLKAGLKQQQVFEHTGISVTHISHIENGTTKASIEVILKIADALSCTPNDILCDSMLSGAKPIFINEISDTLTDCNEYEIRVVADIVKATKISLKSRKNILIKEYE